MAHQICNVHRRRLLVFTDWPLTQWNVETLLYLPGFNFVGIRAVQYKLNRSNILNGAEAVRHAWIHREDLRAHGATPYHSNDVISRI